MEQQRRAGAVVERPSEESVPSVDGTIICSSNDADASASLVLACCSTSYLVCDHHLAETKHRVKKARVVMCAHCGHDHGARPFIEIFRVIPL